MTYRLEIEPRARKNLHKIPEQYRSRIYFSLQEIVADPFAAKKLSGKKKGQYSVRVWPYRIIYTIEKRQLLIVVIDVGHRGNVYK